MKYASMQLAIMVCIIGILIPALIFPQGKLLTNADIVALAKAGLSEAAITEFIQRSTTDFSLEPQDLIALTQAGVADAVITAMIKTKAAQSVSISTDRSQQPIPPLRTDGVRRRLHPIRQDGKFGFIDSTGKVQIRPMFDGTLAGDEEPYIVRKGKKWFYIREDGTKAFEREFEHNDENPRAYPYADGLAIFCEVEGNFLVRHVKCGFMDIQGNVVIPPDQLKTLSFAGFSEGLTVANGGYIDRTGRVVLPLRGEPFREGLAGALTTGGWGFMDTSGKFLIPGQFNAVQPFSEGVAAVQVRGKWGYIDKTGMMIIEPKYDIDLKSGFGVFMFGSAGVTTVGPFSQGLAAVHLGGRRWAFIDKSGSVKIELPFKSWVPPRPFFDGLALVWDGEDKFGYIDLTGRLVWKPTD